MGEEEKIVNVGWVYLSRSEKSLTIEVLNQLFFVPLRDLDSVLQGRRGIGRGEVVIGADPPGNAATCTRRVQIR